MSSRQQAVFLAEARRVVSRRVLLGVCFLMAVVLIAGLIELAYYPARIGALALSFGLEVGLCALALAASSRRRLRPWIIPLVVTASLGVVACVTGYVIAVGASGDALAFALVIFLTGIALMYPWGARGQVPIAVGTVIAYGVALGLGVRGALPLPYGLLSVCGGAVTSVVGAIFLEMHRRAIFHQRLLLEHRRDQQMAMLYEVTRTVTSTLELQEVLRLVCRSVLDALRTERLWLVWREAPDGELRALAAIRNDADVQVSPLADDDWDGVLQEQDEGGAALLDAGTLDVAVLRGSVESRVLRVPLRVRSELVGVILADGGALALDVEASFLDFAATLGNSAAMAIANARLHALVLQHRGELQRLSNKRLDVVEEGMRRISRELHDGTCQALMAIKLDLALLERQLPSVSTNVHAAIGDIRTQVLDVVQSVRQMSHLLHPPVLDDFGAVAAMESVAEKYREASELAVRLECAAPGTRFAPAVELLIFRVFQEALMNIVKHAGATHVQVRLAVGEGSVVLEIDDDGRGFDAHAYFRTPPSTAGLGLIGMRERVAHFGGTFRVSSRPGSGTRLFVSVPVDPILDPAIDPTIAAAS